MKHYCESSNISVYLHSKLWFKKQKSSMGRNILFHQGVLKHPSKKKRKTYKAPHVENTNEDTWFYLHTPFIHLTCFFFTKFAKPLKSHVSPSNLLHFSPEARKGGRHKSNPPRW